MAGWSLTSLLICLKAGRWNSPYSIQAMGSMKRIALRFTRRFALLRLTLLPGEWSMQKKS